MTDTAKTTRPLFGTATIQLGVDFDADGDSDIRAVNIPWSEMSDEAKAAIRTEIQRLGPKLTAPTKA